MLPSRAVQAAELIVPSNTDLGLYNATIALVSAPTLVDVVVDVINNSSFLPPSPSPSPTSRASQSPLPSLTSAFFQVCTTARWS